MQNYKIQDTLSSVVPVTGDKYVQKYKIRNKIPKKYMWIIFMILKLTLLVNINVYNERTILTRFEQLSFQNTMEFPTTYIHHFTHRYFPVKNI